MRKIRRFGLAAVVAAAAAGPALGQTTGGNIGTSTGGGFGTTGATGTTGGVNTGGLGSNASNLPTNASATSAGATLSTMTGPGSILAPSKTQTGTINQSIATSNPFSNYYGNPMFQGLWSNPAGQAPGGFGNVLVTTPGVTAVSTTTSSRTGATGRGGSGIGGVGGTGTTGSALSFQSAAGQVVPLPRQISYTAVSRFQAPVAPPAQIAADLRGMLDRTTMIANPAGVQVLLDATPGVVVLRGAVRDEDEARTAEGMVRLTPGVRLVRNELTFPRP
jgi:hypothetical protein